MNASLNNFSYQVEAPSNQDIFISKGHENTANAITNTIIKHDNIHIVGLEGALGAGKSTIINIVESQLRDENYHFICFDVDQHHHGSTKASFIKVFYSELTSPKIGVKSEAVNDAKDRALGNKFTYTKDVNSKLTYYVLFFLLSLAFSVKYLPEAILNLFNTISLWKNGGYKFSINATIVSVLGFSPLLVLIPVAIKSWYDKKERAMPSFLDKLIPGAPTFGNLLKKNSKDTIDEIIDVTRDVTSFELREAFKVFVDAIPDDKKIVLVIDNLDRLDDSKTKEVWSDLDVFTSACNSRCKIILPFSEYHVAKALKDDGDINTGYEYISKRLPVVFRAPPIVTSGWREQFKDAYWNVTLPNVSGVELCSKLIELWESSERQITPRFLKKHVNDIACIIASSPIDNISAVCCSAYLLSVKYSHVKIEELLSSDYPDIDEIKLSKEKSKVRKLISTHMILKKEMDVSSWSVQLACIHFQTNEDIAGSELLTEPAKTAMINSDADRIIELSGLYGFNDKFSDVIEDAGFIESAKLLAAVIRLDSNSHIEFVDRWMPEVNHLSKHASSTLEFDQHYIDAMATLNEASLNENVDLTPITRRVRRLSFSVPKEPSHDNLMELYQYCRVDKFKPRIISRPSAEFFYEYLWPNRKKFDIWHVEEIDALEESFRPHVLSLACQECSENGDVSDNAASFFKWMASKNKIGLNPDHKTLLTNLDFAVGGYPPIGNWVYSIVYDKRWGSTALVSYLLGVFSKHKLSDNEDECAAFFAAVLASSIVSGCYDKAVTFLNVSNQNQSAQPLHLIKSNVVKEASYYDDFILYLTDYLSFSPSLNLLLEVVDDEELFGFIKVPVSNVIMGRRYRLIDVGYFLGGGYINLNSVLSDADRLNFIERLGQMEPKNLSVDKLSKQFVKDVIENDVVKWQTKIQGLLNSGELTAKYWGDNINSMSPSMKLVLEWFSDISITITRCSVLSDVLKNVLVGKDEGFFSGYDRSEEIKLLLKVMPSRSVDSVVRVYQERLLADTASLLEKYAIIRNFGEFISIPKAISVDGKSSCITLIDNAKEPVVISWIKNQDWSLEDWPSHLSSKLLDVFKEREDEFDIGSLIEKVEASLKIKA